MKFKLSLRKDIGLNTILPKWYGTAWFEFVSDKTICYPIPINVLVAWSRNVWLWFLYGHILNSRELNIYSAYNEGRTQGRQEGYAAAEADFLEKDWEEDLLNDEKS